MTCSDFRNTRAVMFIITAFFITAAKAQEPDEFLMQNLQAIDQIGRVGSFVEYDSNSRAQLWFAVKVCTDFIESRKDSLSKSTFLYHRGRLHLFAGRYDTALADIEHALNIHVGNYPALECLKSWVEISQRPYQKFWAYTNACMEIWKKKCSIDSMNSFNWYYLSKCYRLQNLIFHTQRSKEIKSCLIKAVLYDPANAQYSYELAQYSVLKEKIRLLKISIELEDNWSYRIELITLYKSKKMFNELMLYLKKSIDFYKSDNKLHYSYLSELYRIKSEVHKIRKQTSLYKESLLMQQKYLKMSEE